MPECRILLLAKGDGQFILLRRVRSSLSAKCSVSSMSQRRMSQKVTPPIHWALRVSHKPMASLLLSPQGILRTPEAELSVYPQFVCFSNCTIMETESQQKAGRRLFIDVGKQLEQLRTQALSPCLPGCQRSKSTKNCVDFSVQSHPSMSIPQKKGICYSCSGELSPFLPHYF